MPEKSVHIDIPPGNPDGYETRQSDAGHLYSNAFEDSYNVGMHPHFLYRRGICLGKVIVIEYDGERVTACTYIEA